MMNFFTSDLRRNIIKTVCLTLGLAIGFLLVAKVYFEETYDTFFPDSDRIYRLNESVEMNGEYREYPHTAGAIAPGLKRYSPIVEAATRYCYFYFNNTKVKTDDGMAFNVNGVIMTDSCFFDVLPTEIIAGDPHEALAVKGSLMIPESLAKQIGDDVLGKTLRCVYYPDLTFIINGVYKDYPLNSTIPNDIFLSLSSIGDFTYDGRENWMGNDMYTSLVRLAPGSAAKDIQPHVDIMLKENIDKEDLEMSNYNIHATPLVGFHTSDSTVRTMNWILTLLAVVMLMCAGLNYLLITLGQTGKRSKEMAIRKCYGTSDTKIFLRVLGESIFFLCVSMALAVLLVFCFSETCQQLLGYTPLQLLTTGKVWIAEGIVCLALLMVTGAIPAWIYCRTPVAHSFSVKVKNRRFWKLALLCVQFFAASLLLCMLALVGRQFSFVSSVNMGFEYENIGQVTLANLPQSTRHSLVHELKKLSCVEGVSSALHDFIYTGAGNNVWIDDVEKQVNIADLYGANSDIFDVMGMKFIEGGTFREDADSTTHEVIVEERFYDVLRKAGLDVKKGEMVGTSFNITEHVYEQNGISSNEYTVCGVIGNMKRGGFENNSADMRAAVIFPSRDIRERLYVRFNKMSPENMAQAQSVIDNIAGEVELYIIPYREQVLGLAQPVKQFGLAVMVIGISILLIALIGLIGYVADEVAFRSREVAIRKVSGYSASQIVKLFVIDILKIALPATIAGGVVAIPVGQRWLSQFAEQTSLAPWLNILLAILLLVIIMSVVALNTLSIARDNPVKHLHQE